MDKFTTYHFESNKLHDINPKECGEEFCDPNFRRGPTSRPYYLLHYIFSGNGTLIADAKSFQVAEGQIFIIHPFELVTYYVSHDNPWHYAWLGFELNFPITTLDKHHVINFSQACHIFYSLKNLNEIEGDKELFLCSKIYELLSILSKVKLNTRSKSEKLALMAKEYIDINYTKNITIKNLSDKFNLNTSYFSTLFHKYNGKSPMQYLVDVRLKKAAELIANYNYSITDAAISVGYDDVFHFSKMFKHKFGVSPSNYARHINYPCP